MSNLKLQEILTQTYKIYIKIALQRKNPHNLTHKGKKWLNATHS